MSSRKGKWTLMKTALRVALMSMLLLLASCGGEAATELQVSSVSLWPPNWVQRADYVKKVAVAITFNRAVDESSISAPGTLQIDVRGSLTGNTASTLPGTVQFSGDSKTAVFISDETLADLIDYQEGETVHYTITVIGTTTGSGVADSNGMALDGDADGNPGGNYSGSARRVP